MKKLIILSFVAAMAVAFTACSGKDEPKPAQKTEIELSDNPVDFNVVNPELDFNSRSSYTTQSLDRITVITAVGGQKYMDCHVLRNGNGVWETRDGYNDYSLRTYFWPWSGMDVYAFSDNFDGWANNQLNYTNVKFGIVNGHYCPNSIEYQVNHGNGELSLGPKFDPLIACAPNQTMKTNNGSVHLKFKHLLSRITFAVVNDNADDKVKIQIDKIAIDQLYSHGKYNLYPAYTGVPLQEGETFPEYYGYWSNLDKVNNHSTYESLGFSTTKHSESNPKDNEPGPQTVNKPKANVTDPDEQYELLIIPQTIEEKNDTKLCVDCSITSADGKKVIFPDNTCTDAEIEAGHAYKRAPFPVGFTFVQNTQYVVLIHIGEYNMDIEIRAYPWDVKPFENAGEITPPTL